MCRGSPRDDPRGFACAWASIPRARTTCTRARTGARPEPTDIGRGSCYAAGMKRISPCLALSVALLACGGATNTASSPGAAPKTEEAKAPSPPSEAEPKASAAPEPANTAAVAPAPPAEEEPEKCEGGWVCVKVSFDTMKVEPRETKLIGDPKIEQTWSKSSDGRTVSFDAFSKGAVELTLPRKPGNKNEVVVKLGKGGEIVIDRRDGTVDDFTHVGAIAAEQAGALLVDHRYMK